MTNTLKRNSLVHSILAQVKGWPAVGYRALDFRTAVVMQVFHPARVDYYEVSYLKCHYP